MRAAKSPIPSLIVQQAAQGAEVDPCLAKQLGFCISVAGGRGNLHYPTYSSKLSSLTMTFILGMHWGTCPGRQKPAKVHAAHSIPQHQLLCPSAVPLKGLATSAA